MENHYRYDVDTESHVLLTEEELEARKAEEALSDEAVYIYDLLDETDPETGEITGLAYFEVTPEKAAEIKAPPTAEQLQKALLAWRETASVTMRQARLALIEQGLLSQVNDAIALIPEPDKSKVEVEWEYASTVERSSAWVATLQPALGLTDEQMDDLFRFASTL